MKSNSFTSTRRHLHSTVTTITSPHVSPITNLYSKNKISTLTTMYIWHRIAIVTYYQHTNLLNKLSWPTTNYIFRDRSRTLWEGAKFSSVSLKLHPQKLWSRQFCELTNSYLRVNLIENRLNCKDCLLRHQSNWPYINSRGVVDATLHKV